MYAWLASTQVTDQLSVHPLTAQGRLDARTRTLALLGRLPFGLRSFAPHLQLLFNIRYSSQVRNAAPSRRLRK